MHTKRLLAAFALGLGLALALLWSLEGTPVVAAPAADLKVTKLTDSADGACDEDCSLREAIIAANNNAGADVISLTVVGTYELTIPGANEAYAATGDLNVRDDLTVIGQGPGATIIDANGIDRVFSLNDSTVVISGVTLMEGAPPPGSIGGGIFNSNTDLTLINVAVVSNTSASGGAIRLSGSDAVLTLDEGCLLARNEADYGGGISIASGAQALLNGGQIVSNTAVYGGGVYAGQNNLTMSGVQIVSNTASLQGGGVFIKGTATLNEGAILSNTAGTSGGGVFVSTGIFTQTGQSVIAHNTANQRGGGIHVSHGTVILNGGQISHNRVTGAVDNSYGGGGIYVGAGTAATLIQTGSSIIIENSAAMHGGGVLVEWGRVTLSSGQILSNTAGKNGGGVYLYSSAAFTQTGGLIAYNEAQGTDDVDGGGGLYSNGSTNSVSLNGGQIMENQANRGGGLHARTGSLDLLGAEIVGNHATLFGGGVYAGLLGWNAQFEGGRIISNSAEYGGGLYAAQGNVTLERGQIVGNHANAEGGGVYHDTDGHNYHVLTLVNTTISGNSAPDGSALVNASGTTLLTYTTVASNTTGSAGYGIQIGAGAILAKNTIIAYNDHKNCAEGAVTSDDHNLDSDGSCEFAESNDQSEVDPELAPLAYDIGTLVHAIAPGSPAHDAGACQASITTDQRGAPRIAPCDVGAYEYGQISILTVAKDGTGVGTVDPPVGAHIYISGTLVPITATAGPNSTFEGWSGDLGGATNPTSITMDGDKVVTATFTLITHPLNVNTAGDGSGTVSSTPAGIDCGADCTQDYIQGTVVTLTAVPTTGSSFGGWTGAGCGGAGDCVVTMDAAKQVTATFNLIPVGSHALTVLKAGDGSGTVSSTPAGIDCGTDCTEIFAEGTVVTLTATASTSSTFGGWSGAGCGGAGDCVVTMDAAKQVTATFTLNTYPLDVNKAGDGDGTVSSTPAGIDCGADCTQDYVYGTVVTLTAAASTGSTFGGWSGAGCGGVGDCVVTVDAAKQVTATFTLNTYTLDVNKAGDGDGTVTSTPAGIDCGADCTQDYVYGTVVTLTAVPTTGSTFSGWSGAGCSGAGDCVVTIDAAKQVTATFTFVPAGSHALTVLKAGDGSGMVTSMPAGIDCGTDCTEIFAEGTVVTLTAVADGDSTFEGWSGAGCSGADDCVVTMDAHRQVTATFTITDYTIHLPLVIRNQ
jgi:CSLREA domain-containing protein/uncharacterized repeat protein (TIGR02543 family)